VLLMEIFLGSHLRRAHRTHTYSLGRPQFVFAHGKRSLFNQKKRTKLGFLFRRARVYQKGRLAGGSPSKEKLLKHSTRNIIQVWTHFICSIMYKGTDGSAGVLEKFVIRRRRKF
jgi:hypothetical protein